MTTRYNLSQKHYKRLRQIKALNEMLSDFAAKARPLTPSEKRSVFIAWRNLRRAYEDIQTIVSHPLWGGPRCSQSKSQMSCSRSRER